jgi:hypothetical protein
MPDVEIVFEDATDYEELMAGEYEAGYADGWQAAMETLNPDDADWGEDPPAVPDGEDEL